MPIEFSCTACGQLVRTPDSAAGKKGKCPHCGTIAQIPFASPPSAVAGLTPLAHPVAKPKSQVTGFGGQKPVASSQGPAAGSTAAVISFPCGSCGQTVRTPMSAAGKKGKCPHCQAVVQIPGGAAPAAPATAGMTSLAPLPSQQAGPTAAKPTQPGPWKGSSAPARPTRPAPPPAEEIEELPTLTPIDSTPGLTPLGPTPTGGRAPFGAAPAGGLTPLGPTGGSSPFGADPFGGMGGGDPLAGLSPMNMSGQTLGPVAVPNPLGASPGFGSAPNPYASAGGGYSSGYSGVSDAGRKGLPWERSADSESFQDTAMLILGEPANAFMQMRRSGGIMNSLAFWIIAALIGQVATVVYGAILGAILLAVANAPGEAYAGLAIQVGIQLVGMTFGALIMGPIVAFVFAAIWHVGLLVCGCARGGFEATFRVVCFVYGAAILLNIIPIVGPLVGFFYAIALFIQGFTHAHEVSGGRVTAVVLTFYALLCCCVAPLIVLPLMSAIAQLGAGRPF
jgi:phage FluMu protein Com